MRVLLVGVDGGPKQTIVPLAKYDGFVLADQHADENGLYSLLTKDQYVGVVVGTSGSEVGFRRESGVRMAAVEAGIKLVVIEDYPGNYRNVKKGKPDLLIVENGFAEKLHQDTYGKQCPLISVCKNPRYDAFKVAGVALRGRVTMNWAGNEPVSVLWAGQPETQDGIVTLTRFLPELRRADTRLLFKAHPRDEGYKAGAYEQILSDSGLLFTDVTSVSLHGSCIRYAPWVVLTQYSSLAVEAGFYGIPSLHLLYEDIGAARLFGEKGFCIPPWCVEGASAYVENEKDQAQTFYRLLNCSDYRRETCARFDSYFGLKIAAPIVMKEIVEIIGNELEDNAAVVH